MPALVVACPGHDGLEEFGGRDKRKGARVPGPQSQASALLTELRPRKWWSRRVLPPRPLAPASCSSLESPSHDGPLRGLRRGCRSSAPYTHIDESSRNDCQPRSSAFNTQFLIRLKVSSLRGSSRYFLLPVSSRPNRTKSSRWNATVLIMSPFTQMPSL